MQTFCFVWVEKHGHITWMKTLYKFIQRNPWFRILSSTSTEMLHNHTYNYTLARVQVPGTVAHKGKTQLNIELDTQRFFVIQNSFTRYTTIFRDTEQFYTVHNNFSWCETIFHGAQQFFEIQKNFSRCVTSFRDTKQFSQCTTSFRDTVDAYVEQNSVSRCKIKFHDAQQKFERLVTKHGQLHITWSYKLVLFAFMFVNARAT